MLPGVETGDTGAVHRTRVASRRLRELLPVLELDHAVARKLTRRLKKLNRRLGTVRESDVLIQLLDELHKSDRIPDRALRRVGDAARKARDEARGRLSHKNVAADLKRTAKKLEGIAATLEDADAGRSRGRGWRWAIDARVARRAATLRHAIREAGSMYVPDRVHTVRLALKKLRYGLELSAEAAGVKETPDVRMLKRGQELIGRLRDFQVLIERLRNVQASMTTPDVAAWRELDTLVTSLEHHCRRLHARYVRDRVALMTLCDRLGVRASAAAARRAG
jgi:CHAD domain-containing protein